ncbi:MAG: hypothetical protein K8I29_06710 [Alphaproteobacteria bacterium]|uniref:Uncharacterized protein n=1 Tax=Candidatus Nitrobium versatile TaxID=2884831 RepID=A0A953J432_9BACT|nr:hypothetical protein [Candidatus Nitrobium versatile]
MKHTVHYSSIVFNAFTLLVFSTLVLMPFAPGLAKAFEVEIADERAIPDGWQLTLQIIDPEFDNVHLRALWQSESNKLWISKLEEDTGKFEASLDYHYQLATGLAPIDTENANGPEWVYSVDGEVSIIYTVPINPESQYASLKFRLKTAKENSAGTAESYADWTISYLPSAVGGRCALGTYSENTGEAKILYQKLTGSGVKVY